MNGSSRRTFGETDLPMQAGVRRRLLVAVTGASLLGVLVAGLLPVATGCSNSKDQVGLAGSGGTGDPIAGGGSGGGQGGNGGEGGGGPGGTGGTGGSAFPDDVLAWAEGTEFWKKLAGSEFLDGICTLEVATAVPRTTFEWTSCGTGCEWTEPALPHTDDGAAGQPALGTKKHDGVDETVLQLTTAHRSDRTLWYTRRMVALRSGETLSSVRVTFLDFVSGQGVACSSGSPSTTPLMVALGGTGETQRGTLAGTWDDGWTWHTPWADGQGAGCDFFDKVGNRSIAVCGGRLAITSDSVSLPIYEPATEHQSVYVASADGARAFFARWTEDGSTQLLSWNGSTASEIAEVPGSFCYLANFDDTVAGLYLEEEPCWNGLLRVHYLWSQVGNREPRISPIAGGEPVKAYDLSTFGDFAAFFIKVAGSDRPGADHTIVKRLSDGAEWRFEPHENYRNGVAGPTVDDTHVYVYEEPGFTSGLRYGRVYRYALSELDVASAEH